MKQLKNLPQNSPFSLCDLISFKPGQVISMTLSNQKEIQIILFSFPAGEGIGEEFYPGDTWYFVLEGSMILDCGETKQYVKSGECMAIPGGNIHSIHSLSDFKMLQITFLP